MSPDTACRHPSSIWSSASPGSRKPRVPAWTYFEATPPLVQQGMLASLQEDASRPRFAEQYRMGIRHWREPPALEPVDAWMLAHDTCNNEVCWSIVAAQRETLQALVNRP
jgi:hypothetical protein